MAERPSAAGRARSAGACRAAPSSSASTARAARTATATSCSTRSRAGDDERHRGSACPSRARSAAPSSATASSGSCARRSTLGGATCPTATTSWSSPGPDARELAEREGLDGHPRRARRAARTARRRRSESGAMSSPRAVASRRSVVYQRVISPALPAALQVRADLLALRGAGDRAVRHTARRWSSPAGACCAATR